MIYHLSSINRQCQVISKSNWRLTSIRCSSHSIGVNRELLRRESGTQKRVTLVHQARMNTSEWVFASKWSRNGHIINVAKQWLDARAKAKLPSSLKVYSCRHTFATDSLERTGNLAALMKSLGHSDAQTAMKYHRPGIEQVRKAVEERNRETTTTSSAALTQTMQTANQSPAAPPGTPIN